MKRLLVIGLVSTLLIGCTQQVDQSLDQKDIIKDNEQAQVISLEVESPDSIIKEREEEPVKEVEEDPVVEEVVYTGPLSPLTGLPVEEDMFNRRPIVAMIDNQALARPQAGISQASIVYEVLAEGMITRYVAVFWETLPLEIGPVRSTRPYFVDIIREYDPYYLHCGGSEAGKADLKTFSVANIDGLYSGAFYRVNQKDAPHNLYIKPDQVFATGNAMGYKTTSDFRQFKFYDTFTVPDGAQKTTLSFPYSSVTNYTSGYEYSEEQQTYRRLINGQVMQDEIDGTVIRTSNIIVQYADQQVLDDEGRLDIDIVGAGRAKLYTAGRVQDITWVKEERGSKTMFYTASGEEISLNPGKTWVQIVPSSWK